MEETLEYQVGKLLRARGYRLAAAESCTGGLFGHRITNVPGASTYYMGSVTAYAYEAKVRLLGVQWETLETHGAVSEATVLEMARGVRRALSADIGVAISGIAGPGGGTPEKPVGLTWIGLSSPGLEQAWRYVWPGDRTQVKEQSADQALRLLRDFLSTAPGKKAETNMENVTVTARFETDGRITPLSFVYQGETYPIDSLGRRWKDEAGQHILVMVPGERIFDLVYVPGEARWYLRNPGAPPALA